MIYQLYLPYEASFAGFLCTYMVRVRARGPNIKKLACLPSFQTQNWKGQKKVFSKIDIYMNRIYWTFYAEF